jgi:hypothetical protein
VFCAAVAPCTARPKSRRAVVAFHSPLPARRLNCHTTAHDSSSSVLSSVLSHHHTGSSDLHSFGLLTASIHSLALYSGTSLLNTISPATPITSPETPPQASRSYKHRRVSTLAPTLLGPRPRANDYISTTLLDPVTADSAAAALERGYQPT